MCSALNECEADTCLVAEALEPGKALFIQILPAQITVAANDTNRAIEGENRPDKKRGVTQKLLDFLRHKLG